MGSVYVVVATRDEEIENCETFAGVQSALGRAFQLATNKAGSVNSDWVITSPSEETMPDGSIRWTFMDTSKQKVMVFYRKIEESLLSQKDPMSFLGGLSNTKDVPRDVVPAGHLDPMQSSFSSKYFVVTLVPPYEFMDPTLPVGWFLDNKPAVMQDLLNRPFDVKDPAWLSDDQKWALVTARVRKSPGFLTDIGGGLNQQESLLEFKNKTLDGELIRDEEIDGLHELREALINDTDHA
jgi:hypothetical protein